MTPIEAFELVRRACASVLADYESHQKLQEALTVIAEILSREAAS